jgi:hypothetical protein
MFLHLISKYFFTNYYRSNIWDGQVLLALYSTVTTLDNKAHGKVPFYLYLMGYKGLKKEDG